MDLQGNFLFPLIGCSEWGREREFLLRGIGSVSGAERLLEGGRCASEGSTAATRGQAQENQSWHEGGRSSCSDQREPPHPRAGGPGHPIL